MTDNNIMDGDYSFLNGGSGSGLDKDMWWYTTPGNPRYQEEMVGTVITMQARQETIFNQPDVGKLMPDGRPDMRTRIVLADRDGNIKCFTTYPIRGKKDESGERKNLIVDMKTLVGGNINDIIGKTFKFKVNQPVGHYARKTFDVWLVDEGPYSPNMELPEELTLKVILAPKNEQREIRQPQQQVQYASQPAPMQPQQVPQQVPQMQQPMQQAQPMYQQAPMNPQVMQNMQQQQAQPMQPQQPIQHPGMYNQQPQVVQPGQDESVPLEAYSDLPF